MNSFLGHITDIETNGNMSIVYVEVDKGVELMSIVIDTPQTATYLTKGNKVNVLFKEIEVAISTQTELRISIENKIFGIISDMEIGVLMSRLIVDTNLGEVVAIISSRSVKDLELVKSMKVTIMVKLNEIILAP
ncbi:tobe domain protein [Arenibacter sp. TNZ]|jgi:molybdopterin-binding protein|uniref:TOBE domain-containing protein n=1 Tax=Arenibacter TaxID=178469 RepID=UPI000CD46715|nr:MULTISPECIES: TOBE domain-containing protein [Arenibacter]MCM4174037.1 tobe domain protein [Arenibacter sp. TNZ]